MNDLFSKVERKIIFFFPCNKKTTETGEKQMATTGISGQQKKSPSAPQKRGRTVKEYIAQDKSVHFGWTSEELNQLAEKGFKLEGGIKTLKAFVCEKLGVKMAQKGTISLNKGFDAIAKANNLTPEQVREIIAKYSPK